LKRNEKFALMKKNKTVKKNSYKEKKHRRKKHPLLAIILFVFFAVVIFAFLITLPVFKINNVSVSGNDLLSQDEVLRLANIPVGENIFLFRFDNAKKKLMNLPVLKKVSFLRRFPSSVVIKVVERKVAVVCVIENQSLILDDEGVVMNPEGIMAVGVSFPDITDLPVINGLDKSWFEGGLELRSDIGGEILNMLAEFKTLVLPKKLRIDISEKNNAKLLVDDIISIKLGELNGLSQKVKVFENIYSKIKDRKYDIEYVDVSVPMFPVVEFKD